MGSIQLNVMKLDVWWVTCQLCPYESMKTPDPDQAESWRVEHHRGHYPPPECGKPTILGGAARPCALLPGHDDVCLVR